MARFCCFVRYEWYQTASDVYINVLIKQDAREVVNIEYEDRAVSDTPTFTA